MPNPKLKADAVYFRRSTYADLGAKKSRLVSLYDSKF